MMATTKQKVAEYPLMIQQLCCALDVYEEIEQYEKENGELPHWCAESFELWRQWRKDHGLEEI